MKKIISVLLALIIVCTMLPSCSIDAALDWANKVFNTNQEPEIEWEKKRIWNGDLNANFVIGELMVILDKAISKPGKVHHTDFFVGVEVVEIRDYSTPVKDLNNIPDDYRQILHITLADSYDTKEKTFEAMKTLEKVQGIVSVSPNLILSHDAIPNDTFFDNSTGVFDQWGHKKIEVDKVWDFTLNF